MSTDIGFALLIGLAGMKLVQLYKEILNRWGLHQMAWWKSLLSVLSCLVLAIALVPHRTLSIRLVVGLGASGSAAIWHALDTTLRSHRDKTVSDVMARGRIRSR